MRANTSRGHLGQLAATLHLLLFHTGQEGSGAPQQLCDRVNGQLDAIRLHCLIQLSLSTDRAAGGPISAATSPLRHCYQWQNREPARSFGTGQGRRCQEEPPAPAPVCARRGTEKQFINVNGSGTPHLAQGLLKERAGVHQVSGGTPENTQSGPCHQTDRTFVNRKIL